MVLGRVLLMLNQLYYMALQFVDELYGIELPEAYAKIIGTSFMEVSDEAGVKTYSVTPLVNFYTSSTKENHYKQITYNYSMLENELTIGNVYEKLKTEEIFKNSINI